MAQIELPTGSLLTGQLYIEFDFHPEAAPAALVTGGEYPVLPTVPTARAAIATLDGNLSGLIGPAATLPTEAMRTMREVSAAARALRVFADYLERHPEALIQGKGGRR